ncbi:MAG TPA: hypothetical protein VGM06_09760 [Polyangiaceae bacterium]|jgi:hypothetical protein
MTKRTLSALAAVASTFTATGAFAQEATPPPAPDAGAPAVQAPPPEAQAPAATPAPAATAFPPPVPPPPPASDTGGPPPASTIVPTDSAWFTRAPLAVTIGEGEHKWQMTVYGFVEADVMNDSTRSYGDAIGASLVSRDEVYEGQNGRTQFSIRNSRLGFALQSPTVGGIRPSAVVEGDFFGNQPAKPPTQSEQSYFDSPTFRIRHAYLKLQDDYVDVIAGQTYYLFGWQSYFFPASLEFLPLPNEAFGRTTQVRLSHTFSSDPVNVDIAVAALRPVQRDSEIPDFNGGLRLQVNHWKGISTPGNGGTSAFPAAIGVSGAVRSFKVDAFQMPPTQSSNSATGWGISIDALIPIIAASDANDRGNRLTLTGSFVVGSGISDLVNANGGANFPTLPNPAMISPPPSYTPDIDPGIVTFDTSGVLHTIDWQTFMVGIQYYLPPTGRVILSANYTQAYSQNMGALYPQGGAEIMLFSRVAKLLRYADANVFWDVTPAVRVGASFQYTSSEYVDGSTPRNLRWMGQALYFF